MKKVFIKYKTVLLLLPLILVIFSLITLQIFLPKEKSTEIRSRAAGNTKNVCAEKSSNCDFIGTAGLQQAVDTASDGDIIFISKGTYSGSQETPVNVGWGTSGCFLDLRGKSLTLKGDGSPFGESVGSVLYGEGHSKPDNYVHRAGICTTGGTIIIDSLHIKEFQGRGLILKNATVVIKNSLIDGNDQGGLILAANSSLLAVNNFFVSNIGITTDRATLVKAFNNTFYGSKAINADCKQDIPAIDFVNNIVVDDELTIGAGWIYGNCPSTVAQFKNQHIVNNVIWKNGHPCYENHEYCDNFTGKINADPMLDVAANDTSGWRGCGGNFSLKPGSPAIGAGDPSIPGTKDIGAYGGPCADGNSSICSNFISQQLVPPASPTPIFPTSAPTVPIPTYTYPTSNLQPTSPYQQQPPVTYYLPPTVAYNQPNIVYPPPNEQITPTLTPTITPTIAPLIDVGKTIKNAKSTWNNFVTIIIRFTQTILP
ncbi:hypothetical protein HZB96_02205 [Candidatus Gottesmanbacteria bacterium]|nr:hypothetical protein [Candidatus Gottesmanbacteria bacterium]